MSKSKARIKVASIAKRLPPRSLTGCNATETEDNNAASDNIEMSENIDHTNHGDTSKQNKRPVGRPRKDPNAKAVPVTVTLWPDEYRRLEQLRHEISIDLPVAIPRSDLARLGISLLVEMKPDQVLAELVKQRRQ